MLIWCLSTLLKISKTQVLFFEITKKNLPYKLPICKQAEVKLQYAKFPTTYLEFLTIAVQVIEA